MLRDIRLLDVRSPWRCEQSPAADFIRVALEIRAVATCNKLTIQYYSIAHIYTYHDYIGITDICLSRSALAVNDEATSIYYHHTDKSEGARALFEVMRVNQHWDKSSAVNMNGKRWILVMQLRPSACEPHLCWRYGWRKERVAFQRTRPRFLLSICVLCCIRLYVACRFECA